MTTSSEYFAVTAAEVAAALGLPAPDASALSRCRHKDTQRAALAAAGVPIPAYRVAGSASGAEAAAAEIGYPVVVKPTTGSGSVGVRLCHDAAAVRAHVVSLLATETNERGQPVPRRVLVERYVSGREFSVETFDDAVVGVTGKHLGPPPYFVETGHDFPATVSAADAARLGETARAALAALGLGWGAAHTELRLAPSGPVVVEVNPRLAGGMIPALVRLAVGVDLVDLAVARATGRCQAPAPHRLADAAIRFVVADRPGTVVEAGGEDAARGVAGVALAELTVAPGAGIAITHSFRDRVGYAVATGRNTATAANRARRAAAFLYVRTSAIEPGEQMSEPAKPAGTVVPRWLPPGRVADGHVASDTALPAHLRAALAAHPRRAAVLLAAHAKVLGALTSERAIRTTVRAEGGPVVDCALTLADGPWDDVVSAAASALDRAAHGDSLDTELDLTGRAGTPDPETALRVAYDGESLRVTCRADAFDTSFADRVAGYHLAALHQLCADPGAPHEDASLLSTEETAYQLEALHGPRRPSPGALFVESFEARVAGCPAAPAATHGDVTWTYAELNARANRIAHALLDRGLRDEDVVAVVMDRGLDWVAATLGVLKSGGAYLPVRPDFPPSRIATQLTRSSCRYAVTDTTGDTTLRSALDAAGRECATVRVAEAETGGDRGDPGRPIRPDQLAYVYFTSGSTGEPKGAMCEHAGMLNHLLAKVDDLGIAAGEGVAQTASQCFDISLWQLAAPLLVGGRTVVVDVADQLDVSRFLDLLAAGGVHVAQVVPAYLDALLSHLERDRRSLGDLRVLSVTGEALKHALVRRWFALFPGVPLVNAYGATEVSDDTMHAVLRAVPESELVPLGLSLRNVDTYVLDERQRLVPLGAPGEIAFAGICVGRGYVNDPERTAQAFAADPFRPGARLYRTGDFGRWLPEGTIEFLGRRDEQVKIRGFRIEIGEVENRLLRAPGVREAAVVVDGASDRTRALVAFVTGADTLQPADLRDLLAAALPEYMVPSYFHRLDALPLTENGKVDKRTLAGLAASLAQDTAAYVPPATATERRLATAWAEVLGLLVGKIGRDDDFYRLGGTSLAAVRLVVALDRLVSLGELAAHPVLRDLAATIDARAGATSSLLHRLALREGQGAATLVCFPYAGGNAVNFRLLARELEPYGVDVHAVELPGHDVARPDEPLAGVADVARRAYDEVAALTAGPVLLWGHGTGAAYALALARLMERAGRPATRLFAGAAPVADAPSLRAQVAEVCALSNREIVARLHEESAYIELGALKAERTDVVGRAYRHDVQVANDYLAGLLEDPDAKRLDTPVDVVVAADDSPGEPGPRSWDRLATSVDVRVLDEGGAYFVRGRARDVAALVAAASAHVASATA